MFSYNVHEYVRILGKELQLRGNDIWSARHLNFYRDSQAYTAVEFRMVVEQLIEIARSSLEPRSYIEGYHVSDHPLDTITDPTTGEVRPIVHESVGSHTNLTIAIARRALSYCYGSDFGEPDSEWPSTIEGYSLNTILSVLEGHDLPENISRDQPDNDTFDPEVKSQVESSFLRHFDANCPKPSKRLLHQISKLRDEMNNQSSETGRLCYMADKTSAIFITLTYDSLGRSPLLHEDEVTSIRDSKEMALCDYRSSGRCRGSEMWSADFFDIRKLVQYDDSGFFTAIIVLYTLMVHGRWYDWREEDYRTLRSR